MLGVDGSVFSVLYPERIEMAPRGLPLIVSLEGFSDAGNAVDQLIDYMLDRESVSLLAEFSNDEFLDYRARRPTITFIKDHLADYQPQTLALYLVEDELGAPFLFLAGYEPDFKWEVFTAEVLKIVEKFEVSVTTWVHAIPMPVPHTRPIGTTVSGSMQQLIEASSIWQPTTRLSASIGHALEYRLHQDQYEVAGFVLLIPHYLANTQYPQALSAGLKSVMDATGLLFSTAEVEERQTAYTSQVNEQIGENAESVDMVATLEMRYDQFMRERAEPSGTDDTPLVEDEQDLPTADQLASQLEDFLSQYWGENPPDGNGPSRPSI